MRDAHDKAAALGNSPSLKKPVQRAPSVPMSRIVMTSYWGLKALPSDLPSEGLQVFKLFCRAFQAARVIRETPLTEPIWGLCHGGYPEGFIMQGIKQLHDCRYIALTDANCRVLDLSTVGDTSKVWYMLTDKWLALLATKEAPGIYPEVHFADVKLT
jgi:hypothetical protein